MTEHRDTADYLLGYQNGITLGESKARSSREYDRLTVASRCLQGLLANPEYTTASDRSGGERDLAKDAVACADALLTALAATPEGREANREEGTHRDEEVS